MDSQLQMDICYKEEDSPNITLLLAEFHNSPIGGHHGALKTYQRLAREVYWRGMTAHIRTYVAECSVCQQAKYLSLTPAGFLQALPIPDRVWEDISMDFIEGLHSLLQGEVKRERWKERWGLVNQFLEVEGLYFLESRITEVVQLL